MKRVIDTPTDPPSSPTEGLKTQRPRHDLLLLWRGVVAHFRGFGSMNGSRPYRAILLAMMMLAGFVMIRGAWICDDAMIVFRVVDNLLAGFGLRWNSVERVQTYTCPLWMFLVTPFYAMTRETFFTVIFVSLAVTLGALWLNTTRVLGGTIWSVVFMVLFVFSKTLVDFSTSGLEIPLTYLLLAGFLLAINRECKADSATDRRALIYAFGTGALAMMTRLDNALFVVPPLAYCFFRRPVDFMRIGGALLGLSPLILWEIFSLLYYGTPLPNTAYAKLTTGIPTAMYVEQGLYYVRNLFEEDALSGFAILLGVGVGLASFRNAKISFWLSIGVVLHVLYIIRVGGDHMSGRFLAPDAFLGLTVLFLSKVPTTGTRLSLAGLLLLLGFTAEAPPLFTEGDYINRDIDAAGIVDERAYFNNELAFLKQGRRHKIDDTPWAQKGLEARLAGNHVVIREMVGCYSLFAGPEVHVIDPLGLTDPLISRLPSHPSEWRVGHYRRQIPPGYPKSVHGNNVISDSFLKSYYDKIRLITRGELLDPKRLKAIWELNTGGYDHLLDSYLRTADRSVTYTASSLFRSPGGARWNDETHLPLSHTGLVVTIPANEVRDAIESTTRPKFEVSLRGGQAYYIEFWKKKNKTSELWVDLSDRDSEKMVVRRMRIPANAIRKGYDRIFVATASTTTLATLGHIRFSPFVDRVKADAVKPKPAPPSDSAPQGPAYWFKGKGLLVELTAPRYRPTIQLSVSGDDSYHYEVRREGRTVHSGAILKTQKSGLAAPRTLTIPAHVASKGYDALLLDPIDGKAPSAVKSISLDLGSTPATVLSKTTPPLSATP